MTNNRLTVQGLQIFFGERGSALFFDHAHKRDRIAVETALREHRDFIDRWLDASESIRPRRISEEEDQFQATLKQLGRYLAKSRLFSPDFIKTVIEQVAETTALQQSLNLSAIQISESVRDAISTYESGH